MNKLEIRLEGTPEATNIGDRLIWYGLRMFALDIGENTCWQVIPEGKPWPTRREVLALAWEDLHDSWQQDNLAP